MTSKKAFEDITDLANVLRSEYGVGLTSVNDTSPGLKGGGELRVTFTKKFTYDLPDEPSQGRGVVRRDWIRGV